MILGLILARAGSVRVPGKNIRLLGGKPLVAWTIEAAVNSGLLDRVALSTEDPVLADTARQWGCGAISRPGFLATSAASSYDVVRHALKNRICKGVTAVMLLQPTSPFRTADDIDAMIGMADMGHSPTPILSMAEGKAVGNGAMYLAGVEFWRDRAFSFDTARPMDAYIMPAERSLDIDTEEDFAEAERIVASWAA